MNEFIDEQDIPETEMPAEEVKLTFESLDPDTKRELVKGLDSQLKKMNSFLQEEVVVWQQVVARIRPVVSSERKGRVKCIVCQVDCKKREFKHLLRCPWAQLQQAIREQREQEVSDGG